MLDLELLEKQLDEVLEKETSETMTSWLLNRRRMKYVFSLGEGSHVDMPSDSFFVSQSKSSVVGVKAEVGSFSLECSAIGDDYLVAA
jgi:hypothetical protein